MSVNISGTFKSDDRDLNGLERITKELIEEPLTRHVVVGIVETKRVVRDIADGGTETPTVRFVQIEPLDGPAAERARTMLAEACEARTGQQPDETLFDHGPDDGSDEPDPDADRREDEA